MSILLAIAAFVLTVLLHGPAIRLSLSMNSVARYLLIGFPIGILLVVGAFASFGVTIRAFAAILLYAFLCELYMFIFTLAFSSVSATMLVMLRRGPVQTTALASAYDPRDMVKLRLERLLRIGFVVRDGERLVVTQKGMRYHRIFSSLRRFFGHTQ